MNFPILNRDQIQAWDRFTIENEPISSLDLMERAATTCTKHILGSHYFNSASIFCGSGNNGGDGLVIARLLAARGKKIKVFLVEFSKEASPDFQKNLKRLPKSIEVEKLNAGQCQFELNSDLIIDAIFGIGLNRPVDGWIKNIILEINQYQSIKTISIDIPSGLFAWKNDGNDLEAIIKADHTITFQAPKLPFLLSDYQQFIGKLTIASIGLSLNFTHQSDYEYILGKSLKIQSKPKFSHKGNNGYLTLIGGFDKMTGAIIFGAKSAFKSGSGYVGVISDISGHIPLMNHCPEAIWFDSEQGQIPEKSTALAIGPGLGKSTKALSFLKNVLQSTLPLVLDADAINLISNQQLELPENTILTPHLKELERLIGPSKSAEEMLEKQRTYSKLNKVYVLQKGAFSKLTTPQGKVYVNSTGNQGMAVAGMGDALTGIIGSFLAQGYKPQEATILGMYLHGRAGDFAALEKGTISLTTSDLIDFLPKAIKEITC